MKRLDKQEALELFTEAPLLELGRMADEVRREFHPEGVVTFVVDRNINYTNVCINRCLFCAYYRDRDDPEAFILDRESLSQKIRETLELGGTQILLQGGLHPDLGLQYYRDLFRFIKSRFGIHIHGLSPPEVVYIARKEGLTVRETLLALKEAGLDSIPGGGAEILSDRVRKVLSPRKIGSSEWLEVMEEAHRIGMKTTATMMFGSIETPEEIIGHLEAIRELQDRTGGFTAFIPWSFQPKNTALSHLRPATATEYLRVLAISRLYLDNIRNIQASWVTQGLGIAQVALRFGANDLGSTMIEENVVRAAGVTYRAHLQDLIQIIRDAGYRAAQRNTFYEILRYF